MELLAGRIFLYTGLAADDHRLVSAKGRYFLSTLLFVVETIDCCAC